MGGLVVTIHHFMSTISESNLFLEITDWFFNFSTWWAMLKCIYVSFKMVAYERLCIPFIGKNGGRGRAFFFGFF